MHLLDTTLFIVRYIPFWSIPCFLMGLHFAYIYWLKEHRLIAALFLSISLFCLTALIIFAVMGGPEEMAGTITHIFK